MTAGAVPDRATAAPAPAGHGWRAVSIVLVGAFMALLDTTIVNVALPSIRSGLHAPASTKIRRTRRTRGGRRRLPDLGAVELRQGRRIFAENAEAVGRRMHSTVRRERIVVDRVKSIAAKADLLGQPFGFGDDVLMGDVTRVGKGLVQAPHNRRHGDRQSGE